MLLRLASAAALVLLAASCAPDRPPTGARPDSVLPQAPQSADELR